MSKYKVNDKFVLEIKEVIESDKGTLYRSDFNTLVFDDYGLDKLEKHKELRLQMLPELREAEYNRGMNDAWELAKKLYDFSCDKLEEIFGVKYGFHDLIHKYSSQEALAKIETYEKEQVKVGDVIAIDDDRVVVTKVVKGEPCTTIYGIEDNGCAICYSDKQFKKTGKHIDVQQILSQIN